ncbi:MULTISPECIES: hypothetical protein [unclassified Streptomyces]|uniref:hypothetical protein n=1 Tax=unclassified Streptomyces TaxID=2593676 RepID=UPI0036DFB378
MTRLSELEMLRFLEHVQERDLWRTRRWIEEAERREDERTRGAQARPPAPEWLIEMGLGEAGTCVRPRR